MSEYLDAFVFDRSCHEVRIVRRDGRVLFRAADVGKVLGLKNVRESLRGFDEDEKDDVREPDCMGRMQLTSFLTRDGVYRLVMRSNKAIARPFQKWISKILGAIEDTGRYDAREQVSLIVAEKDAELAEANAQLIMAQTLAREEIDRQMRASSDSLLHTFHRKNVVYVVHVKREGEQSLVKIGSTKDNLQA